MEHSIKYQKINGKVILLIETKKYYLIVILKWFSFPIYPVYYYIFNGQHHSPLTFERRMCKLTKTIFNQSDVLEMYEIICEYLKMGGKVEDYFCEFSIAVEAQNKILPNSYNYHTSKRITLDKSTKRGTPLKKWLLNKKTHSNAKIQFASR